MCTSPVRSPQVHSPHNTLGIPSPNFQTSPSSLSSNKPRQPPPYRPPPPVSSPSPSLDNISLCSSISSSILSKDLEDAPPQAPPRRRSQTSRTPSTEIEPKESPKDQEVPELPHETADQQVISVKERTQKFNRLASVDNDLSPHAQKNDKKRHQEAVSVFFLFIYYIFQNIKTALSICVVSLFNLYFADFLLFCGFKKKVYIF